MKANVIIPINLLRYFSSKSKINLPPNEDYNLIVTYPIGEASKFPFNTGKNGMDIFDLLKIIDKAYARIYDNCEKYGVWGHDVDDLNLEEIKVNSKEKS